MNGLDDVERGDAILNTIRSKAALLLWYGEVYDSYADTLDRCPADGLIVELGAGVGFAEERIPDIIKTDVLPYNGVDFVFDAAQMPFPDDSVRVFCMLNVFHHLPDAESFLAECERCLRPGGRVLIVDQYPGWIAHSVLKHVHHEPYAPDAETWSFDSSGPLSGANGALAWIVFFRDRDRFEERYSQLKIDRVHRHTPLRYWLSGGLKSWSLIPRPAWGLSCLLDRLLLRCSPEWAGFMNLELVKVDPAPCQSDATDELASFHSS